jgi:hypothetical protein
MLQKRAPLVGCVEVSTLPQSSRAAQNLADGQEIALTGYLAQPLHSFGVAYHDRHAELSPRGRVEVNRFPELSPATQRDRERHEIASSMLQVDGSEGPMQSPDGLDRSTWTDRHAARPPVGRVEVITLPALSTTAQKDRDGHETAITASRQLPAPELGGQTDRWGSSRSSLHAEAIHGSVETYSRLVSNATHNDADAHEMPRRPCVRSTCTRDQPRPDGARDASTLPLSSTAAQKVGFGHEIPSAVTPSRYTFFHDWPPWEGCVEATMPPASSTATHKVIEGQEIASVLARCA